MKNVKCTFLFLVSFVLFGTIPTSAQNNFLDMTGAATQWVLSDCALSISGNDPISLEFWLRKEDSNNNWMFGYGIDAVASGSRYHFVSGSSNGSLHVMTPSAGEIVTGYTIPVNEWHHYAMTWDGTTLTVYVDGTSIFSNNYGAQNVSAKNVVIGYPSAAGAGLNGQVDEIRVWSAARTATEIQDNMNAELTGTEADLEVYYKMNDGSCGGDNTGLSAPQATDNTGNGCGGNLSGFALNGCNSNFVCETTCNYPGNLPIIPTMGEWALIIFGLLIASMGVISAMRWQREQQLQAAAI